MKDDNEIVRFIDNLLSGILTEADYRFELS